MKVPPFRISWLMILVAFVAVDFAVIRAIRGPHRYRMFSDLALVGVLPTLNLLGICLLAARVRPRSRPFLLGFIAFGVLGLLGYLIASLAFTDTVHDIIGDALNLVFKPFFVGRPGPGIVVYSSASVIAMAPQLLSVAWRSKVSEGQSGPLEE